MDMYRRFLEYIGLDAQFFRAGQAKPFVDGLIVFHPGDEDDGGAISFEKAPPKF